MSLKLTILSFPCASKHGKSIFVVAISLAAFGLMSKPLDAQTTPPIQLPKPNLPEPSQLQPSTPLPRPQNPFLNVPIPNTQTPETLPNGNKDTIWVSRFVFKGNTKFTSKQLQAKVSSYIRKNLTFAELAQARSEITSLYINAGYVTTGAFIPAAENQYIQSNGGVVTIRILEGKLEAINVTGSRRLQSYVYRRLRAATSPVLNNNRLQEALRLLQINPLIKSISAQESVGYHPGKNILDVRVQERQPISVEAILDNNRDPAGGTFERGIHFNHANLLGLGDGLSLSYLNTDGSNAGQASYTVPINLDDGTVQFSYTNDISNIIEPPFNKLHPTAAFRSYEFTIRQPLIRTASAQSNQEFALGFRASRQESDYTLMGSGKYVVKV